MKVGIVRLLVREMSGAWYVDQGLMTEKMARDRKADWNKVGWGCLILKHQNRMANLPIVARPEPPMPWRFR